MIIRFTKDAGDYKKGQTYRVSESAGRRLIAQGLARKDKMMTEMKTK